jgi:GMP synthase (glutamine-hydrolysing)
MRRILVLRHSPTVPAGHLAEVLRSSGIPVERADLFDGDPVPRETDWSGIVSLGGLMGAYEQDRYPWLSDEKRLLAAAADAGVPVLGICLGCQMLADALGGRAYRAEAPEVGMLEVGLTGAGRRDPVVGHMDAPVPVWHGDTWDLPPGAELLASTTSHPHAFRLGSALGIQSHPEATPYIVARWIAGHEGDDLERAGTDPGGFLEAVQAGAARQREMAVRLFAAWTAEVWGDRSDG